MRKSRFTEEQIIAALKEHEAGARVRDLSRKLGITEHTFYRWRSKWTLHSAGSAWRACSSGSRSSADFPRAS